MEAPHLEDCPEAKRRTAVVAATKESSKKELKNRNGRVSAVNRDLCIVGGVCGCKCPSKSLVLEGWEVIEHPRKDARKRARLIMADFAAARTQSEQGGQNSKWSPRFMSTYPTCVSIRGDASWRWYD